MSSQAVSGVEPDLLSEAELAAHVRGIVEASRTSFYWAMRLLPPHRRDAIYAVYAFCREVDDVADSDDPAERKVEQLRHWRVEVDRLFDGNPTEPVMAALVGPIGEFGLERQDFLAVIEGMEMDARGPIRAPSMADLEAYCARVASAVGLLCIRIFGVSGDEGRAVARSLGLALQLTNILRDVREDAGMGRLYLPRELLEAHGVTSSDPDEVLRHPNLPAICRDLGVRASREFADAREAIGRCDLRAMRPAVIMMHVYQRTLVRMTAEGFRNVATYRRTPLRKMIERVGKILIALRYWMVPGT